MAERLGGVAASEELPVAIEVDPPGVASALGEQLGAEILIHPHSFDPLGDRVLQVLQHPEAPAIVEGNAYGLPHHRLMSQQLDLQPLGYLKRLVRLVRRHRGRYTRRERRCLNKKDKRHGAPQAQKGENGERSKRRHRSDPYETTASPAGAAGRGWCVPRQELAATVPRERAAGVWKGVASDRMHMAEAP